MSKDSRSEQIVSTERHVCLVHMILNQYGLSVLQPETLRTAKHTKRLVERIVLIELLVKVNDLDEDSFQPGVERTLIDTVTPSSFTARDDAQLEVGNFSFLRLRQHLAALELERICVRTRELLDDSFVFNAVDRLRLLVQHVSMRLVAFVGWDGLQSAFGALLKVLRNLMILRADVAAQLLLQCATVSRSIIDNFIIERANVVNDVHHVRAYFVGAEVKERSVRYSCYVCKVPMLQHNVEL